MDISNFTKEEAISFLKKLEIQETVFKFATEYHRNMSGQKMRWDTFQHMLEIYEDSPLFTTTVIMAGTQLGKTDFLIIYVLAAAYCGLNVFYILPKGDMRDNYVQEKVLRPVSLSPEYQTILKTSIAKKIDQIQFGKGIIRFVGANSETDMTSFSADIVVIDETDQVTNVNNLDLGMSRLDGSMHKFKRLVSNPSDERGVINLWYEKSDKRVRKYPCKECGVFSEINWFKSVVKEIEDEEGNIINRVLRDKEWEPGDSRDIYIKCPCEGCDGNIDRFSINAFWEPTAISERKIVGYHMPSIISPLTSVTQLWYEYVDGWGSPSKMEKFYRTRLALPFSLTGNKISVNVLENSVEEGYIFEIREDCAFAKETVKEECVMGVDVASDHWDISISHKAQHKHKLVYIGKQDPRSGLGFLHRLVDLYNVKCVVIDNLPQTIEVRRFQEEAKCTVWRCQFWNTPHGKDMRMDHNNGFITVSRREMLDNSYTQLKIGNLILPQNYDQILEGTWEKEMKALKRITEEDNKGRPYHKWIGPKEDHARLSDGYRNIAREFMMENVLYGKDTVYIG